MITVHDFYEMGEKAEVDFVLRNGDSTIPIEVKYRDMKKIDIRRSFGGFVEGYCPERGYVVNKSLHNEAKVGDAEVRFIPYWELMFEEAFPFP